MVGLPRCSSIRRSWRGLRADIPGYTTAIQGSAQVSKDALNALNGTAHTSLTSATRAPP